MKLQELNQNELTAINGGAILGGSNLLQGNILGPLTIGNVLSVGANSDTGVTAVLATGSLNNLLGGLNLGNLGNLANLGGLGGLLGGL